MQITVNLPDELALRLQNYQQQLPEIFELGLREFNTNRESGFEGMAGVLEFLAQLPQLEEILVLCPSQELQAQIDRLLEKNHTTRLTAMEEQEGERYQYLEHLVRIAKAEALLKLKQS